jgi:hypothetical protein
MPSGELVGTTLKFTGREVTDGHSHFSNINLLNRLLLGVAGVDGGDVELPPVVMLLMSQLSTRHRLPSYV